MRVLVRPDGHSMTIIQPTIALLSCCELLIGSCFWQGVVTPSPPLLLRVTAASPGCCAHHCRDVESFGQETGGRSVACMGQDPKHLITSLAFKGTLLVSGVGVSPLCQAGRGPRAATGAGVTV